MLMHIFKVGVGMTFSGGLIDMSLFGILQGNAKTKLIYIVIVGIVYFIVYYLVFSLLIKKLNLKTPGREDDDEETKLYTRSGVNEAKTAKTEVTESSQSVLILKGLGGKSNLLAINLLNNQLVRHIHRLVFCNNLYFLRCLVSFPIFVVFYFLFL